MFSSRFKWSLEQNRLAQLIGTKRAAGAPILDLTESNPTRAGFSYPHDLLDSLAQAEALIYEPAPRGLLTAREAVAGYYREKGFSVDPDRIHLTASTSEGYSFLFKLLADQAQSVLVPRPSYPLFDFLAALEGVELRPYELDYVHPHGWRIDFHSLERALNPQTRAIILVSPNNPTGSFIKNDEVEKLNEICLRHGLALIVDEVFSDYAIGDDERRVTSLVENENALTFVMSGFSKLLGLPQMKLGWIVTNGPRQLRERGIERLDLIADTFLSVGAPVQHAAPIWLKSRHSIQDQILTRVRANLSFLTEVVDGTSCRLLNLEGGWSSILEVPRAHTEEEYALKLLEEDNVLIHPGYFFDFDREAFLAVSLLPVTEVFSRAVRRIAEKIAEG